MKIDGSEQRKTPRGVCSRAHGKRAGPSGYKLSRAQASFWPVFGTAILPTGTSEPSRRAKEVSKRKKAVISEQREEMASVQGEAVISKQGAAVISEQREEMASEQGGEEVLPGGDDGFGGKTVR